VIVKVVARSATSDARYLKPAPNDAGEILIGPLTEQELRALGADCLDAADELELARKAEGDA
jgi:hypothetical protein